MLKTVRRYEEAQARRASGFTIIELMITVAVVGVLAAMALPSMNNYVRGQRVKTASFEMFATMSLARSEAIKRNGNVVITQETGGWQDGWIVTSGGDTLRSQGAFSGVAVSSDPAVTAVTYSRDGRITTTPATSTTITFTVNGDPSSPDISPRCISVGVTGLPTSRLSTTGGC